MFHCEKSMKKDLFQHLFLFLLNNYVSKSIIKINKKYKIFIGISLKLIQKNAKSKLEK